MTFTTSVLTPMQPREIRIILGCTIVNLALAALLLVAAGTDVAGTEFALRMTARISFVYFVLVFVASPLERLGAGRIGSWLSSRRRAVGVVFGISMSIHVAFIVRLFTSGRQRQPQELATPAARVLLVHRRIGRRDAASRRGRESRATPVRRKLTSAPGTPRSSA